ncbi:MAG: hypothetical protein WBN40_07335 [Pseudomonadales bacterium]
MSYSWLETLVDDVNHPDIFDLGVSIHLARSDDGGDTWTFERDIKAPEQEIHPDTLERGYSIHEVSTIGRGGPLGWELLWFKYFTPLGADNSVTQRSEFLYFRSDATDPRDLGVTSDVWARGASTSDSWGAPVNLSDIADVSDCVAFTEPSLLRFNDRTFVVMLCSFEASIGNPFDPERVVLFEEVAGDYRYVADVMDGIDAEEFDADFLASPDISIARDGTVILIVTPVDLDATPQKSGCIVFEFADFENGLLLRDTDDSAIPRTIITSDGDNPGPGLCTYSAQSSTGVLLIMHDELVGGSGLEFSLRATGVHP